MCVCTCSVVHLQRSEDDFVELVLFDLYVGSGIKLMSASCSKYLYPPSHLVSLCVNCSGISLIF